MTWQPPQGMEEYLKATELCDCDNSELKRRAKEIIKDAQTPKEAASRIFSFVRDDVVWASDLVDLRASKTLKKRQGVCQNKVNLHVALLRSVGIPARYHQVNVKREGWKDIMSGYLYNKTPDPIWFHAWCECYLEKWIACESVFDETLYRAMLQEGLVTKQQIPTIDWDGKSDLVVVKPWLTEDMGTFASLDEVFKKAQKEMSHPRILALLFGWLVILLSNRRTDSVRKKLKQYSPVCPL